MTNEGSAIAARQRITILAVSLMRYTFELRILFRDLVYRPSIKLDSQLTQASSKEAP